MLATIAALLGVATLAAMTGLMYLADRIAATRSLEHFPLKAKHIRNCGSSWRIRLAERC